MRFKGNPKQLSEKSMRHEHDEACGGHTEWKGILLALVLLAVIVLLEVRG